jgi:hypothetical protein
MNEQMGALAAQDGYTSDDTSVYRGNPRLDPGLRRAPGSTEELPGATWARETATDFLVPQTPLDYALMLAGPAGKLPKVARAGALALGGILGSGEAQAGPVSAIKKGARALFDYSKIHEVPDVKQFGLDRYDPPRGVSSRVEDLIGNKRVEQKMLDIMDKGRSELKGDTFYYNEPLRQAFTDELGKKQGQSSFARYMDYVAGTSPRSKVPENARNASYYYTLEKRGLPLPDVNPQPYGHMAQDLHRLNAEKIRSGEYLDPIRNPKPLSFSQNLQGNFEPGTIDAHAFKLPAMLSKDPRFISGSIKLEKGMPTINPSKMLASGEISMKDALQRPVYWASKPNANEYGAMEQYYQRLSRELGMAPAQGQGSAWAKGGEITGLGSVAGDPFMRAVENRVNITAAERGLSPAEALSQMIRGKAPLLGIGGAAATAAPGVMGGLASQENY